MKADCAWEFFRIRFGCPARGEKWAIIIIFTVEAELSQ